MTTAHQDRLSDLAAELSSLTLAFLEDYEAQSPGAVYPIIVHFKAGQIGDQAELLWYQTLQGHREYQHDEACKHANRVQAPAREFLQYNREARDCFAKTPGFQFEPVRHARSMPVTNTMIVLANRALAEKLARIENVVAVQRDVRLEPLSHGGEGNRKPPIRFLPRPGGESRDGLTWGWKRLGLAEIASEHHWTGRGINVGIIDSGTSEDHADLKFKVKDFVIVSPPAGLTCPSHSFDNAGHGSFVAGTVVGASNHQETQIGGATASHLKVAATLYPEWWSNFISACEWLTDRFRSVNVINVSMGILNLSPPDKVAFQNVLDPISKIRTLIVAAIGNRPGASYYPAALPGVVGVGAFGPGDRVCSFSGQNPDLILPGSDIYSCIPAGLQEFRGRSYCYRDGTSFASPHLSAIIALLLEGFPHFHPRQIVEAIKLTADSIRDETRERQGYGIPNLTKSIVYLKTFHGN